MSEPKQTRVVFFGFAEEGVAAHVLEIIKDGIESKDIVVDDWAMVHKAQGGEVTTTTAKPNGPGVGRGSLFGGGAGMILAALSGPIGIGAVAAGAAVGAVTAAVRDSGFKTHEINEVSTFMADGRTGLMIGIPMDEVGKWDAFVSSHPEFEAPDVRKSVDIVPGHSFETALEEYRLHEED